MVNNEIFELADKLKNVASKQMEAANKALLNLPEGETKDKLKDLLRRASTGKVSVEKAQEEINKIVADGRRN